MNSPLNPRGDLFIAALHGPLAHFITKCPACASLLIHELIQQSRAAADAEYAYVGDQRAPAYKALELRPQRAFETLDLARYYRTCNRVGGWPNAAPGAAASENIPPDGDGFCPAMTPGALDTPLTDPEKTSPTRHHRARVRAIFNGLRSAHD